MAVGYSRRKRNSADARRRTDYDESAKITYIGGSAAPALDPVPYEPERRAPRPRRASVQVRRNREKARYMSFGYAVFLIAAIGMLWFLCYNYLTLRTEITTTQHRITEMESNLNELRLANDEEYGRIMGAVDLEEIKRIAMDELGMTYPSESQIVAFADEDSDYVRQYQDIPQQ